MLNQNFPITYKNKCFMVDPVCLTRSSRKFYELIQQNMNDQDEVRKMKLEINYEKFSERNVENFLKLCQNIPTDCTNTEVEEICEIAKMFKADQIYETGLNFVQKNIDPNFNVPDKQFDESNGQTYLILLPVVNNVHHHLSDFNSLEFEDDEQQISDSRENIDPNSVQSTEKVGNKQIDHSAVYQIKIVPQSMKLPIIQFISNNEVLFTAKRKKNQIVIGKGQSVHLNKDRSNHIGQISMDNGVNKVTCDSQEFQVKFVYLAGPGCFSIDTEFMHDGMHLHWKPKMPKYKDITQTYSLSLHGEYHRNALKSARNTVLCNDKGEMTMIVRKTGEDEYEVECNPKVSKSIIFAIGLSQIIGPNSSSTNFNKM